MAQDTDESIAPGSTNGPRSPRTAAKHAVTRRTPGRATRQILSGADLVPPPESSDSADTVAPVTLASRFLIALAVLVVGSTLVWAIWGMGAATPLLLLLALGLIASWLVL